MLPHHFTKVHGDGKAGEKGKDATDIKADNSCERDETMKPEPRVVTRDDEHTVEVLNQPVAPPFDDIGDARQLAGEMLKSVSDSNPRRVPRSQPAFFVHGLDR